MKIFKALGSGSFRSLKAWKGIIILWFCYLIVVSLVAIPLKGSMKTGIGDSMITERFLNGIDIEVLADLGSNSPGMFRNIFSGVMFLIIIGIILNSFFTGGLFNSIKSTSVIFSAAEFFRACAKYFWSFLGITLIISTILFVFGILIVIVPIAIAAQSDSGQESTPFLVGIISGALFAFITMILLLVADYARAWQVRNEKPACFKALGFGFGRTFRTFLSSFPMMLILVIMQFLFGLLVMMVVGRWKPVTGGSVFLLFLLSQFFFFTRLILKTWRYGSVTSLMEISDQPVPAGQIINPI